MGSGPSSLGKVEIKPNLGFTFQDLKRRLQAVPDAKYPLEQWYKSGETIGGIAVAQELKTDKTYVTKRFKVDINKDPKTEEELQAAQELDYALFVLRRLHLYVPTRCHPGLGTTALSEKCYPLLQMKAITKWGKDRQHVVLLFLENLHGATLEWYKQELLSREAPLVQQNEKEEAKAEIDHLTVIGNGYEEEKNYENAITVFEQVLELARIVQDYRVLFMVLDTLSRLHFLLGNRARASELSEQASEAQAQQYTRALGRRYQYEEADGDGKEERERRTRELEEIFQEKLGILAAVTEVVDQFHRQGVALMNVRTDNFRLFHHSTQGYLASIIYPGTAIFPEAPSGLSPSPDSAQSPTLPVYDLEEAVFVPPEVWFAKKEQLHVRVLKVDIYSLGILFVDLLTDNLPRYRDIRSYQDFSRDLSKGRGSRAVSMKRYLPKGLVAATSPWWDILTEGLRPCLKNLIISMTKRDPKERPDSDQVLNVLRQCGAAPTAPQMALPEIEEEGQSDIIRYPRETVELFEDITKQFPEVRSVVAQVTIFTYALLKEPKTWKAFLKLIGDGFKYWSQIKQLFHNLHQVAESICALRGSSLTRRATSDLVLIVYTLLCTVYLRRGGLQAERPQTCQWGDLAFNFIFTLLKKKPCNCVCSTTFTFAALEEQGYERNAFPCSVPGHVLIQLMGLQSRDIIAEFETTQTEYPVVWLTPAYVDAVHELGNQVAELTSGPGKTPVSKLFDEIHANPQLLAEWMQGVMRLGKPATAPSNCPKIVDERAPSVAAVLQILNNIVHGKLPYGEHVVRLADSLLHLSAFYSESRTDEWLKEGLHRYGTQFHLLQPYISKIAKERREQHELREQSAPELDVPVISI